MAGGSWTAQNKVRPGIYINFTSKGGRNLTPGGRGVLAGIRPLSWGPVGELMTIDAGADVTPYTGYGITSPQARFLREAMKGTDVTGGPTRILLYRPAAAENARISRQSMRLVRGGKRGEKELDSEAYTNRIIVAATLEPDFSSEAMCKAYGTMDPVEVPGKMLYAGEYKQLMDAIMALSHFDDDLEDEAKN